VFVVWINGSLYGMKKRNESKERKKERKKEKKQRRGRKNKTTIEERGKKGKCNG
jgi:hypothetical protein